ncbi:hypothetical protein D9615_010455 [Tricholomella constricta]|uniref:Uncharacterized protein n=1 Tax=Tricholomella constricta TaxID=117010 RepID=A0A8H5GLU1_9AGAR|nr:hypothetical protein D9615_010455 [Tricholomella constricta]
MTTYIDDQDLSKVNYTGTWIRGGSNAEYKETVASSTVVGDYFTVTFRGTNIAVFGTFDITSKGVVTTYSVDGAPPAQVTSQAGSGDTHRQQFWRSDPLVIGPHKLVVNMSKVNFDPQPGEGTVWFDYFLVTDPTITSSGTPLPAPSPPGGDHKGAPVGAIVGAVIGGLFFLLAVGFLLLLCRRCKRIRIVEEKREDGTFSPARSRHKRATMIEPFLLTADNTNTGGGTAASTSTSTSTDQINPALLTSGPAHTATRKSAVIVRPGTGRFTQSSSLVNRTDNANHDVIAPVPDEPLSGSSTTELAAARKATAARERESLSLSLRAPPMPGATHLQPPGSGVQGGAEAPPQVPSAPATASQSPGPGPAPAPLQHVDSGVRATNLEVAGALERVELPPVYTPV